jgi:hypothetical protein
MVGLDEGRAKTPTAHEICISGDLVRMYSDYMVDEYGTLVSDFVFGKRLWPPHDQERCE